MDNLYEDILNTLKMKKTVDPIKKRDNQELEKTIKLIEELLKTIKAEQIILLEKVDTNTLDKLRTTKRVIIKKIKQEINRINNKYHLRIEKIITEEEINQKELEFALELLYQSNGIKEKTEKANEYSEQEFRISYMQNEIERIKEITNALINNLKLLKEQKETNLFGRITKSLSIKEKKSEKETQKRIINLIDKLISKELINELCRLDMQELKNIKNQLTSRKEKNYKRIISKIEFIYKKIEKELKKEIENEKIKQVKLRKEIKLTQEHLNDITKVSNKSYSFNMSHESFINQKDKKETLLVKTILTLKLISIIEQNDNTIIEKLEEEQAKTK